MLWVPLQKNSWNYLFTWFSSLSLFKFLTLFFLSLLPIIIIIINFPCKFFKCKLPILLENSIRNTDNPQQITNYDLMFYSFQILRVLLLFVSNFIQCVMEYSFALGAMFRVSRLKLIWYTDLNTFSKIS